MKACEISLSFSMGCLLIHSACSVSVIFTAFFFLSTLVPLSRKHEVTYKANGKRVRIIRAALEKTRGLVSCAGSQDGIVEFHFT